jgi:hypothetical protein
MEGVFSSQLAELEKNGLMVDGIHHRFTFFNKVHLLFSIHSVVSKQKMLPFFADCLQADMSWANKLNRGSGPSSLYPSSWINMQKHDLATLLPYVLGPDGTSVGGLRRDAVISYEEDALLGPPHSRRYRVVTLLPTTFTYTGRPRACLQFTRHLYEPVVYLCAQPPHSR